MRGDEVGCHQDRADGDEAHDGSDLDQCEPKLQLPEVADAEQIDSENQGDRDQGRDPDWQAGPPKPGIAGDRDEVCDPGDHQCEPVRPPHEKARRRAPEVGGEVNERLVVQVRQQQLAHRAQHKKHKKPNDPVDHHDRRTGERDRSPRSHE